MLIISRLGQSRIVSPPIFEGMDRDFLSGYFFQLAGTRIVQQHLFRKQTNFEIWRN